MTIFRDLYINFSLFKNDKLTFNDKIDGLNEGTRVGTRVGL